MKGRRGSWSSRCVQGRHFVGWASPTRKSSSSRWFHGGRCPPYASTLLSIDDEVLGLLKGGAALGVEPDPIFGRKILGAGRTQGDWRRHSFHKPQPGSVGREDRGGSRDIGVRHQLAAERIFWPRRDVQRGQRERGEHPGRDEAHERSADGVDRILKAHPRFRGGCRESAENGKRQKIQ